MELTKSSRDNLDGCHSDLRRLVEAVAAVADIYVTCGHRSEKDQNKAFHNGYSKEEWPNSRHNTLPSQAVDLAPRGVGGIDWYHVESFRRLATVVKEKALELGIDIEWGGDWEHFKDYPHFQLAKK